MHFLFFKQAAAYVIYDIRIWDHLKLHYCFYLLNVERGSELRATQAITYVRTQPREGKNTPTERILGYVRLQPYGRHWPSLDSPPLYLLHLPPL